MTIRVWQSFSCNNSSSYRLVARFADPRAAGEAASELTAFFSEHAEQMDALTEEGDFPNENPAAAQALATRYGFAWDDVLSWGDEAMQGDEPGVAAEGDVLVVYHTYCGGYGPGLPAYLAARGATKVEKETREAPSVTVLFQRPVGDTSKLDADLDMLFAQAKESRDVSELETPWKTRWGCSGSVAFYRDAKTVGMFFNIAPIDIPPMKAWLADRGVVNPSIRLCEYADEAKLVALAAARCSTCHGALEYLDPRVHGIATEQLACAGCGGMFDVATVVAAHTAKPTA